MSLPMSDIEFLIKTEIAADVVGDEELAAEARKRMGNAPKAEIKRMNEEMRLILNDDPEDEEN
jgi:hypothetical protein